MRRALIALAVLTMCPAAAAQTASPVPAELPRTDGVSLDPSDAPAGAYALDSRHAFVTWRVRHTGLGIYVGRFDRISATLNFDPADPTRSTLTANIETNSVSTGLRNAQGELDFDGEIANVLGASSAPQISFVSNSITRTGPTTGLITGDLTLNGQTHPATLEATFQGGKAVALRGGRHVLAFSGRTIIDRKQWGVGSLIFDRFASNEVEILIEGEFVKS